MISFNVIYFIEKLFDYDRNNSKITFISSKVF